MPEESRLVRMREGRILTGVCTGLGRYTSVDPVVFRVGFAVLVIAGHGSGIFLYIAAFLLMPGGGKENSIAEQVLKRRLDGNAVLALLGALLVASVLLSVVGGGLAMTTGPLAVIIVCGLALLVAHERGVNLVEVARTLPRRFQGRPLRPDERRAPSASSTPSAPSSVPSDQSAADLSDRDLAIDADTNRKITTEEAEEAERRPTGGAESGTTRVMPADAQPTDVLSTDALLPEPPMTEPVSGETPPPGPPPSPPWSWGDPTVPMGPAEPARPPSSRGGGSVLTRLTLLAALAVSAATIPVTSHESIETRVSIPVAAALAVLGVGLVIASWYGRSRGMVSLGVVLCLALVTTSAVGELPQGGRWGDVHWRPADARAEQSYKVIVGGGNLDLTGLPLSSGQRVRVRAEVSVGGMKVTVPGAATTEVHAHSSLGDVDVAGKVTSGPGAKVNVVLTAEGKINKNAPVIELYVRGRLADVQVRRVTS
jgi:phage shock protein PspC (stress-responsive transcriptional regulator)